MINQALFNSRIPTIIFFSILCFSCNPKNDTVQQSDNLSQETTSPGNSGNEGFNEPVDTNNAVKVPINTDKKLNWEEFRENFHIEKGIAVTPKNIAAGEWISNNEYEYRRVYRLENNTLWIQTFYKRGGTSSQIDTNVTPKALSLQESELNGLGTVWNEMIKRGLFLTDSLSN